MVKGRRSRSAKAQTSLSTASARCRSSKLSKSRIAIDLCFGSGMSAESLKIVHYTRAGLARASLLKDAEHHRIQGSYITFHSSRFNAFARRVFVGALAGPLLF